MAWVQQTLFKSSAAVSAHVAKSSFLNGTNMSSSATMIDGSTLWGAEGVMKTDPTRLQNQMFAYTVTNQIVGNATEVGLPFVMSKIQSFRAKRHTPSGPPTSSSSASTTISSNSGHGGFGLGFGFGGKKSGGKRVVFEDEERGEKEEREFLERVRHETALPEYTLFEDYAEMATQFGYVALWSTIWPLASGA